MIYAYSNCQDTDKLYIDTHTHTHTHTYIHPHKWRKEENKREGEKETGGEKRKRLVISKFTY